MNRTAVQRFNDKVALIYEYNKKSPLFVRAANTEIENNNVEKGIEILKGGLLDYPDYAAAHIMLGKAYTLTGSYTEAMQQIRKGCDMIHSPETYNYYLKECDKVKRHRSLFEATSRTSFFSEVRNESEAIEPDLFLDNISSDNEVESLEDTLEQLAKEITSVKFSARTSEKVSSETDYHLSEDRMIVSETLAKIYLAQGEYKEAIDAYKKLIKKHPEKQDYYRKRIQEIKEQSE